MLKGYSIPLNTGLYELNGKFYYCFGTGKLQRNDWKKIDGYYYYFGDDGAAYTSRAANLDNDYYYFDETGKAIIDYFDEVEIGKIEEAIALHSNSNANELE